MEQNNDDISIELDLSKSQQYKYADDLKKNFRPDEQPQQSQFTGGAYFGNQQSRPKANRQSFNGNKSVLNESHNMNRSQFTGNNITDPQNIGVRKRNQELEKIIGQLKETKLDGQPKTKYPWQGAQQQGQYTTDIKEDISKKIGMWWNLNKQWVTGHAFYKEFQPQEVHGQYLHDPNGFIQNWNQLNTQDKNIVINQKRRSALDEIETYLDQSNIDKLFDGDPTRVAIKENIKDIQTFLKRGDVVLDDKNTKFLFTSQLKEEKAAYGDQNQSGTKMFTYDPDTKKLSNLNYECWTAIDQEYFQAEINFDKNTVDELEKYDTVDIHKVCQMSYKNEEDKIMALFINLQEIYNVDTKKMIENAKAWDGRKYATSLQAHRPMTKKLEHIWTDAKIMSNDINWEAIIFKFFPLVVPTHNNPKNWKEGQNKTPEKRQQPLLLTYKTKTLKKNKEKRLPGVSEHVIGKIQLSKDFWATKLREESIIKNDVKFTKKLSDKRERLHMIYLQARAEVYGNDQNKY